MTAEIPAVGLHSLFYESDRIGTDAERHVLLCDLDSHRPVNEPAYFRREIRRAMKAHGIPDVYVVRTLKGVHLLSPWLQSRRHTERFEQALARWGTDEFHGFMGYANGGTVIRITPKPGEGKHCPVVGVSVDGGHGDECLCLGTGWTGPAFVAHVRVPDALAPWSYWSGPHWEFLRDRYGLTGDPNPDRRVDCGTIRLEHYWTPAPRQGVLFG